MTDESTKRGARRRRRRIRAITIATKRLSKEDLGLGRALYPSDPSAPKRPKTRAECHSFGRPCPFVSCRWHLYLDVMPGSNSIKLNFPDLEVWELKESCALDLADRGGITLEDTGEFMNLTRERIRQVELRALVKVRRSDDKYNLRDYH